MKNAILTLLFVLSLTGYAQNSINDYSFVVVPENFEFLGENDKYDLNSMTNFLLKKNGFTSFMESDLPNVRRCDGIYADVVKTNRFLRTILTLVLKDCNGTLLFKAEEGNSKEKDYRKSYQDALRKTFRSLSKMDVSQKPITVYEEISVPVASEQIPAEKIQEHSVVATNKNIKKAPTSEHKESEKNMDEAAKLSVVQKFPDTKFSSYTHNDTPFLLRKTKTGYALYEETSKVEDGLLLIGELVFTEDTGVFTQAETGKTYRASFDASENLTIQNEDTMLKYTALH